jgi:site-specific DNA-methyltransferase (adenine-specific)
MKLIVGDSLQLMREMEPESVDCIVTDPPYGETTLAWDKIVNWLDVGRSLLKPHGSIWFFTSIRHLLGLDLDAWHFAQDIVWEKHNGSNFHADRFRRVHELAVQIYPRGVKWADVYKSPVFTADAQRRRVHRKQRPPHMGETQASVYESLEGGPRLARSVMRVRSCHGYAIHPTQKPEDIVRPLIEYSCPPGGTVLDPFAGSGTTLEVARQLGRNAIGIDLNPQYVKLAHQRLHESCESKYGLCA